MSKEKKKNKIIQVPLTVLEIKTFNKAFKKSGIRSEADFMRYLIKQYADANT